MKQSLTKPLLALFLPLMIVLFSASCKKSDHGPKSIFQTIASDPNYSYLTVAISKANLQSALNGDGKSKLTLFAPDNNAFISAGFKSPSDPSLTAP